MSSPQKFFQLSTGSKLPAVGLGTWQSTHEVAVASVKTAIEAGYRHIDTAWSYGNEASLGEGIRQSSIPREELFITDKLWQTWHSRAEEALNNSLESLGVEYLDLWLMHWPVPLNPHGNHAVYPKLADGSADFQEDWDYLRTWKAMEDIFLSQPSKLRAIGVSNCSTVTLRRILEVCRVVPAVNQVELHPFCSQPKLSEFCAEKGIQLVAYSPLGSGNTMIMKDERIATLAKRASIPVGQLILSWGVQKGWAVLPKSTVMDELDAIGKTDFHRTCRPYWSGGIFHDDESD